MDNDGMKLVCPFLTDDPLYAAGVELGMLYMRMEYGEEDEIDDYFHSYNQEQITVLAGNLGWYVEQMEQCDDDWFHLQMRRGV